MFQLTPKQSYLIVGGAFVLGGAVGFLIGKKTTEQKLNEVFDGVVGEAAQAEIEAARLHYARLYKRDEFADPSALVDSDPPVYNEGEMEELQTIVNHYTSDNPTVTNIFVNGQSLDRDFDYDAERAKRDEDPDKPYVISHDEFMENEPENEQVTVTYFEGDGILANERDEPIDDEDETVGTENLTRFGHGSRDNNVVYIRNDRLLLDFEVVKSTGSYAEEVAGLQHSDSSSRIRKFRDYDE